jgi:methylmalonyl-CoA mutase
MTVSDEVFAVGAGFPAASREEWQRLVAGVLAKAGKRGSAGLEAERALATEVEDGLWVQPLYTAEDTLLDLGAPGAGWPGFAPFTRGGRAQGSVASSTGVAGWDVRQQHAHPDPRRANEAVLADLENGVTSLWLTAGGAGLPVTALPDALQGVHLDLAGIVLDAGAEFATAAEQLFALFTAIPARSAAGNLGADPLGLLARSAQDADTAGQLDAAAHLAECCAHEFPGVRALTVDALPYHDAGASAAQELGLSLATAVAYLRELTRSGLTAEAAAGQLEFRYAASADQFLTIAKLRAARRLWSRVAEVCAIGPAGAAQRQHAVTSMVMMTERDPWVNMLRTTVACLAAGAGGADAITVLPFDSALGLPDDFARRIARNTQAILLDESNLARVIDPAGGSWYVERLTDQLARGGWDWFQQVEQAGGQHAALRSGWVAERISRNWAKRSANLANRREAVTGVSEFPALAEQPLVRDRAPARPAGGLPRVRRSAGYEALRSRSDVLVAVTGARPRIALAALGSAAVHTPRSTFAANLFQAGGIETTLIEVGLSEVGPPEVGPPEVGPPEVGLSEVGLAKAGSSEVGSSKAGSPEAGPSEAGPPEAGESTPGKPDLAALAEAFTASGARAACICSSDALYATYAQDAAAALKAAGARWVVLAGRAGDRREAYHDAGVDAFVYAGCDALAALTTLLEQIGASR